MKRIMTIVTTILLLTYAHAEVSTPAEDRLVMFWNLENFFDYHDQGTGQSDTDFTPSGSRRWTAGKFFGKCRNVAKAIMWMGDKYGRLPDVIGLAEIENSYVLYSLIHSTLLEKHGYRYVHYDSDDHRGIDVALIYRDCLELRSSKAIRIDSLRTRDILLADFGDVVYLVNHHPSKFSGAAVSSGPRAMVMRRLRNVCDSLIKEDSSRRIVAMGDFNDTPDGEAFSIIENSLENKAVPLFGRGEGTIRFEGKWDLIDMFLTYGPGTGHLQMETVMVPWLITKDNKHSGVKPLRTYSGPRFIGGVSDHLPVILRKK